MSVKLAAQAGHHGSGRHFSGAPMSASNEPSTRELFLPLTSDTLVHVFSQIVVPPLRLVQPKPEALS